jgi:FHA domain
VSGIEKLLARIRALFAPRPVALPRKEVDVTPAPPVSPPEAVEARAPVPVGVPERPLPEEPPARVEEPVVTVTEAPQPIEEIAAEAEVELAPADGLTLRLEAERGSPSTFQVTKSGATIGRGPESTIQLADLSVSRKHARITYKQGAYWLSDLGSMGGTWIDGAKLAAPRRVATGQTIDIGLCRLTVVAGAEDESTGAAKGPSNAA